MAWVGARIVLSKNKKLLTGLPSPKCPRLKSKGCKLTTRTWPMNFNLCISKVWKFGPFEFCRNKHNTVFDLMIIYFVFPTSGRMLIGWLVHQTLCLWTVWPKERYLYKYWPDCSDGVKQDQFNYSKNTSSLKDAVWGKRVCKHNYTPTVNLHMYFLF